MSGDKPGESEGEDWVDRAFKVIDPIVDRVAGVMSNLHAPDKEYTRTGVKMLHEDVEDAEIVGETDIAGRTVAIELVIRLHEHSVRLCIQDVAKAQSIMREERISVGQWLRAVVTELETVKKQLKGGE